MNDGGPAFPTTHTIDDSYDQQGGNMKYHTVPGMTLRDFIAVAALQGLLANSGATPTVIFGGTIGPLRGLSADECLSQYAYQYADAMLKERDKK